MSRHDIARLAFVLAGIYVLCEAAPALTAIWLFAPPQSMPLPGMTR